MKQDKKIGNALRDGIRDIFEDKNPHILIRNVKKHKLLEMPDKVRIIQILEIQNEE